MIALACCKTSPPCVNFVTSRTFLWIGTRVAWLRGPRNTAKLPDLCSAYRVLAATKKRVEELKKTFPKAKAIGADDVRVIYLVTDDPKKYFKYAAGV